jgi:RNA-binding protein YlmH
MNRLSCLALAGLALLADPAFAQDESEIIVTATRISSPNLAGVADHRAMLGDLRTRCDAYRESLR